jgi:hypothetical protein
MSVVFAISEGFATHPVSGLRVHLRRDAPWPADDPLVRALPHLFASLAELTKDRPVESASQAPGERRTVKRG